MLVSSRSSDRGLGTEGEEVGDGEGVSECGWVGVRDPVARCWKGLSDVFDHLRVRHLGSRAVTLSRARCGVGRRLKGSRTKIKAGREE